DVAQRGTFQFAVAQWTRWFAFKIENHEIFAGIKQLSEMIIAVDANFRGVSTAIEQPFFACEYFLFRREHLLRFISKCPGEIWQFLFEKRKRAPQRCAHVLVNRALRHGAKRFRRERGTVSA